MLSPVTGAKMLRWMLSITRSHPGRDTSMDKSTHMDKLISLKITHSGKHDEVHHLGVQGSYSMCILRKHSKPLSCQMYEATEIECSKAHVLLNSKGEYNGHRVPWVTVEVGSRVLTQEYRGSHQRQQGQPGLQGWTCESLEDHPAEDTKSSNTRIEETGSTTSTTLDLTTDRRIQQVLEWESQGQEE